MPLRLLLCLALVSACSSSPPPFEDGGPSPDGAAADSSLTDGAADSSTEGGTTDGPRAESDGALPSDAPLSADIIPPRTFPRGVTNGTRVEATYVLADEQALFAGFYDTQINAPCRFRNATDGTIRCVPAFHYATTTRYYTDASCTRLLVPIAAESAQRLDDCPTPAGGYLVGLYSDPSCAAGHAPELGDQLEVIRVGAERTPSTVYAKRDGACRAVSVSSYYRYFLPAEVLAPASMPKANVTVHARDSGTRLEALQITTTDGASRPLTLRDTTLDERCKFSDTTSGTPRCVPREWANGNLYYSDASCATRLALQRSECRVQRYALVLDPGNCTPSRVGIYAVAGAYSTPPVYLGTSCTQITTMPDSLYTLGADVTSTLAGGIRRLEGAGRIKLQYFQGDDGSRSDIGAFDSQLGFACRFVTTTDGKTRCLPPYTPGINLGYADAACTQRAARIQCGTPRPAYITRSVDPTGCATVYEAYAVGNALPTTSIYFKTSSGQCTASSGATATYYEVTGTAAPATFAEGTAVSP